MSEEKKYPEVIDLRYRMKHYEFRRDENYLMLTIRKFEVFDDERLRFTLSPCFNHVMMVLDTGPESDVQHIANLYPPIRSQFNAFPKDEEFIYEYQYGMNARDGALSIRFKIVDAIEKLPKHYLDHLDTLLTDDANKTPVVILKDVGEVGFRRRFELRIISNMLQLGDSTGGKAYEKIWDIDSELLGKATYKERDQFLEDAHRAVVGVIDDLLKIDTDNPLSKDTYVHDWYPEVANFATTCTNQSVLHMLLWGASLDKNCCEDGSETYKEAVEMVTFLSKRLKKLRV